MRIKRDSFDDKMRMKRQTPEAVVEGGVDAVIQLTGGVLQSLFSVAYTDDVRKVVNRIDKIDEDLKKDIGGVKTNQDSLQQRTVSSLTKQDSKMLMVEKMARTVERKVKMISYRSCTVLKRLLYLVKVITKI